MFKCRFTIRVWNFIFGWLGWQSATPSRCDLRTVNQWWISSEGQLGYSRKVIHSLQMLIYSEIWNERNARVFCNKYSPPSRVAATIREEAKTWVIAGAIFLGIILPGE
ncbi:hypothetical protein CFC21_060822 [Triticum aestivum]|uniref:Uncharacterized protein n=2 Tax=Triticum aestivum TaxID=4565 RepID=A0A3B6JH87_WHEAT|nr:hypothetical protein CFC21_060822 [Triticum aestivum]